MLELHGVTRRFGAVTAVDSVTLAIPNGQMPGVIGRSGAGTSTLLRVINRLVEPSEGRILVEGVDVTALRGRRLCDWRGRCAMVFQQFNLVQRLDVLTNVLVGRLSHRGTLSSLLKLSSAEEQAKAIRAHDWFALTHAASQRADTLSGGRLKRTLPPRRECGLAARPRRARDDRSARHPKAWHAPLVSLS